MGGLGSDIVASLIASSIGFVLGALFVRLRLARRYNHLEGLVPADRRVQIVLPSTRIGDFEIKGSQGDRATQPSNVLMMPLPEGSGVAQLILALRTLTRRTNICLTTDDAVSADYGLTISIGGPSVNLETRRMLREHPRFEITYPEHVAEYADWSYVPKRTDGGEIVTDFGFVFLHRDKTKVKISCCGVWGAGTEAAIEGLLKLADKDLYRQLRSRTTLFMAFRTDLDGLHATDPVLVHVDDGRRMTTWH